MNYKIEDLMVNITNYQCMVMRQMSEAVNRQTTAIENVEKVLQKFAGFSDAIVDTKLPSFDHFLATAQTPSSIASPPEPAEKDVNTRNADDPDWEGDDKTGESF